MPPAPPPLPLLDVVVVGGGPAGLNAALVLGRSRRRVLVVDEGRPRNAVAAHMHGFLTRDGMPPEEFLELGRREVAGYGVELRAGRVEGLLPDAERGTDLAGRADDGHRVARDVRRGARPVLAVVLEGGEHVLSRRVLVATGLRDELPDIPGVAERWGRDVLHCPYCHGWEARDAVMVVVARTPEEVEKAGVMRQWSADVTLLLHGLAEADVPPAVRERLTAVGVRLAAGPATGLVVEDDRLTGVRLADGSVLPCGALVVQPTVVARDGVLVDVGAEVARGPFGEFVVTDETGATGVPGIWAAGNVTEPHAQVVMAAAAGYRAALAIDHDLVAEDLERAVADDA